MPDCLFDQIDGVVDIDVVRFDAPCNIDIAVELFLFVIARKYRELAYQLLTFFLRDEPCRFDGIDQ